MGHLGSRDSKCRVLTEDNWKRRKGEIHVAVRGIWEGQEKVASFC